MYKCQGIKEIKGEKQNNSVGQMFLLLITELNKGVVVVYTKVNMFAHYSSQVERVKRKRPIDIEIRKLFLQFS